MVVVESLEALVEKAALVGKGEGDKGLPAWALALQAWGEEGVHLHTRWSSGRLWSRDGIRALRHTSFHMHTHATDTYMIILHLAR